MFALRYVYVLALAIWLGGMVVLGAVVAPATFQTLQATQPAVGRALAGAVFGNALERFHYVAYGAGAVLLVSLGAMALLGPRPRGFSMRLGIAAVMLLVALYSGLVVLRELESIQSAIASLPSGLPGGDGRSERFDQLHALSTGLMTFNIIAALALLYWEAREHLTEQAH